ncbi:DUF2264 domain-containing protein [Lapidilactobacillus wuchangensis]|uniref:DUF2264 domain-containing protein n=1 Tax=Lapidilactobacillus wuchangensis TaxID=2486001 RepID=UPI000F772612|nr:DUF2264 domain-containing protein [Lapidilactobacillus wuchangensis]
MTAYNKELQQNPLKTRADYEQALLTILAPVYHIIETEKTPGRVHLGDSGSVYEQSRRDIEGFMRTLWGVGPLCSTPERAQQHQYYYDLACQGILAGVNPESEFYWGELHPYDQLFVEMGSLATMLTLTKDFFWDELTATDQQHIFTWLNQINQYKIPDTNWLFFRVLVNNFFEQAGLLTDSTAIDRDLAKLDSFYLNDGWYFDGYPNQIDYYIPFGMQYYGVLYAVLGQQSGNPHLQLFRDRASQFAATFKNWFVNSGAALPFGRSLTYRFAQSGFWAVSAFAKLALNGVTLGEQKYLLLQNMRHWFSKPIFSDSGLLTIGYMYPNLVMAEGYNAPGSPYWALKNFIALALPDDDEFWQAAEVQPKFVEQTVNPYSRMLMIHDPAGDELQAFTAGQHSHEHAHGESKYEKYVYSTTFGFSVKKGDMLVHQGAFDNTLALSDNGFGYQTAFGYQDYQVHEQYVYSLWQPWPDVKIKNFIIPCYPWHFRVHVIETGRTLNYVEGSFSAPVDGQAIETNQGSFYDSSVGTIGIVDLNGNSETKLELPEPNTNLCYARTILPILRGQLASGKHILFSACLGAANEHKFAGLPEIKATLSGNIFHGRIGQAVFLIPLAEI